MRPPLPETSLLSTALILLSCAPLSTLAVPWTNIGDNSQVLPTQDHRPCKQSSHRSHGVFPRLTWLRDTAIEKVFGVPPKSEKTGIEGKPKKGRPASSQLPAMLLAKYGGDVVLRFNISTPEEEAALSEAADTLFLDVWEFNNNWADIRLAEDDIPSLLGLLPKSLHKAYSNLMPDLARTIYRSYPSITWGAPTFPDRATEHAFTPKIRASASDTDNIFFRDYQPLSVLNPWMRLMASMFTTHVRMISIGLSYEGRDIPALRVGVHPSTDDDTKKRKTIIVNGGSHAREWISVSSVTYIAWSLITSYGKSPTITKLLQEFDWVFIPTLNVDGYVYSWETDRLWRKNRQQTPLRFCRGIDVDRSFGYQWDGTSYQSNPCSESYPGNAPFQAVESHRLAEWAKNETENNNVTFVGFLDLHSYSQQVLYPYSYSCSVAPGNLENLEELGTGLVKAIRLSSGEYYTLASACEGSVAASKSAKHKSGKAGPRMETGGGSAIDWFYHDMRVRYAYQIKLRDTGSYGFLLPGEDIIPTGEEAFNALKYFGDFLMGDNGIESSENDELSAELENVAGKNDDSIQEDLSEKVAHIDENHIDEEIEGEDNEAEIEIQEFELRRRRR